MNSSIIPYIYSRLFVMIPLTQASHFQTRRQHIVTSTALYTLDSVCYPALMTAFIAHRLSRHNSNAGDSRNGTPQLPWRGQSDVVRSESHQQWNRFLKLRSHSLLWRLDIDARFLKSPKQWLFRLHASQARDPSPYRQLLCRLARPFSSPISLEI